MDRRLAWLAAAWVAVTAVAALVGADPSRGLTAQTGGEGGGLMVVAASAVVLLAGVGLDDDLRERARRWFVATAAIIAVFAVLVRLFPGVFGEIGGLSFVGATMGNQLFGAALVASAIPAAASSRRAWGWRTIALVALLALGTATFGERSAVILPIAGVAGFLVRAKMPWRRAAALAVTVVAVLGLWQVVAAMIPEGGRGAEITVQSQATDQQRFRIWSVLAREAVPARPVLGWGPAESQAAYLATGTVADVATTSREWADAHDLLLETLVTSGVIGLLALLAVLIPAGLRAVRCPPERAWAFGAATTLGVYALFEPVGLVLTPLLFFMLGAAAGPARVAATSPAWGRVARLAGTAILAAGLVVSLVMATAATFEEWGIRYGEEWAYRTATRVQPWRITEHRAPGGPARRRRTQRQRGGRCASPRHDRCRRRGAPLGPRRARVGLLCGDVAAQRSRRTTVDRAADRTLPRRPCRRDQEAVDHGPGAALTDRFRVVPLSISGPSVGGPPWRRRPGSPRAPHPCALCSRHTARRRSPRTRRPPQAARRHPSRSPTS